MSDKSGYTIYGIKNCDTVKKALRWLDENGVSYSFHDFKSKGITASKLKQWVEQQGWEAVVNKKGLTWKQLPEEVRQSVKSNASAVKLLQEKTSAIKRPVVEKDDKIQILGFDEDRYSELFS
jgi:arsenate reductase (glutaredoxin)